MKEDHYRVISTSQEQYYDNMQEIVIKAVKRKVDSMICYRELVFGESKCKRYYRKSSWSFVPTAH